MNHDPAPTPPPGTHRPPQRKSPAPRRKSPPSAAALRAASTAFRKDHDHAFGAPSGESVWEISFSENPQDWFYTAAKEAGESVDVRPPDSNHTLRQRLTNRKITACIGPWWLPGHRQDEGFLNALRRFPTPMVLLGPEPIPPHPPADSAWKLRFIGAPDQQDAYVGGFRIRFCHALGGHSILSADPGPGGAQSLTESIRKHSLLRMHGGRIITRLSDDEAPVFGTGPLYSSIIFSP